MNWKLWLRGLAAAAIGGAATGATQALSTGGGAVNSTTALTSVAGALVTVLAYLAKSPLGAAASAAPAELKTPSGV